MGVPVDQILENGTITQAYNNTNEGLILQELKIIRILLAEGFGVNLQDEDYTLLRQAPTPPTSL